MTPEDIEHKKALLSRMEPELEELVGKTTRLWSFITSESYETLPKEDRMDLAEQWRHMEDYSTVLKRRVDRMKASLVE